MTISDFDFISSKYLILKNSIFSTFCNVWQCFSFRCIFVLHFLRHQFLLILSPFKILAFRAKRDFLSHLKDST